MAYNPFNIFRRNQKAIFAVVTVFIMFTFVLSSGLGGGADFFDWLPRWLGSKSQKGEVVCTIGGEKISDGELTKIRFNRVMANRFMDLGARSTIDSLERYVSEQLGRLSPQGKEVMDSVNQTEKMLPMFAQNPMFAQEIPAVLQRMRAQLGQLASGQAPSTDKEVARAKLASIILQQTGVGREHYFQNAPNRNQRDLVEFLLWQKKADQLGIKYTTDDVKTLIAREFFGFFQDSAQVAVQKSMRQAMQQFTMDSCLKAIAEEFRVRAAQAAVLGGEFAFGGRGDKTFGGFPQYATPYEIFDYYREECSPTTYAAIPVPAANFMDRVPEPNEADAKTVDELKKLYREYKDDEPNPARETPGFKDPRKAQVAFFSVNGTEPYYTKASEERLKAGEPLAKAGSMMLVPFFGVSPAELAQAVAPLAMKDALVEAEYKRQVTDDHKTKVDFRWGKAVGSIFSPLDMLLDTSVVRPGNLAVAAGTLAGQFTAFGNPFAATAVVATGPIAYEVRDRVKAGMPAFLGAVPGPGLLATLVGGEAAHRQMVPKAIPIDAYRPNLMKDLLARNARELALADAQKFVEETAKLSEQGKAKDKAAVQKFIDEFVAARGLKVTASDAMRTEWTIEEDPALAPLVTAQKESLKSAAGFHGPRQYIPFGERFFWTTPPANPFAPTPQRTRSALTGTHAAMYYPIERPADEAELKEKSQFVVWRKAEEAAKPLVEQAAWPAVKQAWKRMKAREMAKARAEALANTVRSSPNNSPLLLIPALEEEVAKLRIEFADLKAQARIEPFLVRGVAPLTTVDNPTGEKGLNTAFSATIPGQLHPFALRPSENLKYPTNEIGKTLLDERTKQPKTALVLTDAPKDTYFVVTLIKRELKTDSDFRFEVMGGDLSTQLGGPIVLGRFRQDTQFKAFRSVIGLLKKEFKYEETEEQKKKLEENEKRGGDA